MAAGDAGGGRPARFAGTLIATDDLPCMQVLTTAPRPDLQCYNKVIASYGRARLPEVAEEWLTKIELAGLVPNLVSYSTAVAAYARVAEPEQAARLVRRMRDAGVTPDTVTYNALLDAHVRAGQLHQAQALVRRMERSEAGERADVVSYTILLSGLARRGRLSEAARWLEHMEYNATVAPDATTYNTLMAGYASRSMWAAMDKLIGRMRDAGIRPDEYTYGPILEAARRIGQRQRARSYGRRMLLDSEIALSPFCLHSLRRSLGLSQLRALVDELPGVSWDGVEAALVRYDEEKSSGGAGGGDRGRRRGRAGPLGSTGRGAAGTRGESALGQGGLRTDVEVDEDD